MLTLLFGLFLPACSFLSASPSQRKPLPLLPSPPFETERIRRTGNRLSRQFLCTDQRDA